jgi:hypothetical protein
MTRLGGARSSTLRAAFTHWRDDMSKHTLAGTLVLACAVFGAHAPALAAEGTQDDWAVMMSTKGMDMNKDGMVSKKEFLDMMSKAYDMKAKSMKSDRMGMSEAQLKDFLKSLYVGG